MLLPGPCAARVRRRAAELIVRYLGGDLSIISEVMRNRGLQEELAVGAPQDPRRAFGEAVEAEQGTTFQQVLEQTLPHLLEKVTEKLLAKIDERFDNMEKHARPAPYALQSGTSNAPLTIPSYLNEQERRFPGFATIRKAFAPSFSTLVSMLKHEAVRNSGGRSSSGKRAYTEKDRGILNHAWDLSFAYREALASGQNRPSVLEMLRTAG